MKTSFLSLLIIAILYSCGNKQADADAIKKQLLDSIAASEKRNDSIATQDSIATMNAFSNDNSANSGKKIIVPNTFDACHCFINDKNPSIAFSLCESKTGTYLRYKGQKDYVELLQYDSKEIPGDQYTIFETYYSEILVEGEVLGNYKFVRSGNNQECTYTRKKDGKTFVFNLDLNLEESEDGNGNRKIPCF